MEVLDFYSENRLSINKVGRILINPAVISIIVRTKKGVKEFIINIPKKYSYECQNVPYIQPKKRETYYLLKDFLKSSKEIVVEKYKMDDKTYKDFSTAIDICMIKKFSNLNTFMKGAEIIRKLISSMRNK